MNDLTAILNAGEGVTDNPLPPADPLLADVLEHGMTDADSDDSPPGIHISASDGRVKVIREPSRDQAMVRARQRARLGAPPQDRMTAREFMGTQPVYAPAYAPAAQPMPMGLGAQVMVQGIDLRVGVLLTSHGAIPLSPEIMGKIMQLGVSAMRSFYAESIDATMQAYNLKGVRRGKKRRKPKKV